MSSQKSNSNFPEVHEIKWWRSTEPTLIPGKIYIPKKNFNVFNNIQLDWITCSIDSTEDHQFLVLNDPMNTDDYITGRKYWYAYVIGTKSPFVGWLTYQWNEFKDYITEVTPNG